ncbi:MAG TPA: Crp/Fnr family transcriptional regulator [Pyrinomonadaceae bacterium]|nr:Crp/Fnr family transcriptional regulator [Pyrinomonadaceae bacterium]
MAHPWSIELETAMMNAYDSNNALGRNNAGRAGHGDAEAPFGARQVMRAERRTAAERKNTESASLNALLANEILSGLPTEEFERLLPHLEPVTLVAGEDLYQFEGGVTYAYFPESVVISQLHILGDGNTTEAAMVGREGLVGLSAVFNAPQPAYWTRVLVAGNALRIRVDILKQEFGRGLTLQRKLLAYTAARMAQLSMRAVCTGSHKVDERLCCWLLMLHDRARADQLQLTHELIASHLGVRRAGITVSANALRDVAGISYSRGQLRILDRQLLEAAACECYQMMVQPAGRVRVT